MASVGRGKQIKATSLSTKQAWGLKRKCLGTAGGKKGFVLAMSSRWRVLGVLLGKLNGFTPAHCWVRAPLNPAWAPRALSRRRGTWWLQLCHRSCSFQKRSRSRKHGAVRFLWCLWGDASTPAIPHLPPVLLQLRFGDSGSPWPLHGDTGQESAIPQKFKGKKFLYCSC